MGGPIWEMPKLNRLDQSKSRMEISGLGTVIHRSARSRLTKALPGKNKLVKSRRGRAAAVVIVVVDIVETGPRNKAVAASAAALDKGDDDDVVVAICQRGLL